MDFKHKLSKKQKFEWGELDAPPTIKKKKDCRYWDFMLIQELSERILGEGIERYF